MTRPGIEPKSLGPLANTLPTIAGLNTWYDFIYNFMDLRFSSNMNIMNMCKI